MNLYLIGFRGCGKSTVGPLVAEALAWTAVDSDQEIETLTSRSIATIFAEEGEAGFREWETSVIQGYMTKNECVISLGGGAPTIATNRDAIKSSGKTVLLKADSEVLWERICKDPKTAQTRPSLTDKDGYEEVVQLLEQRAEVYAECADYTVDTGQLSPQQIADQIANWFDPVDTIK